MEEKKKFKLGLLPKLIIAIIVGILFGQFLPEGFCRFVVTLSSFFSQFLSFIIPLMILAYVTMGIANLKSGAGKLLLITVAIAYCSTLIAGSASFFVADTLFPHFMSADALDKIAATAGNSLEPYFSLEIPALMNTLSAVVTAFVLGLCMSSLRGKIKRTQARLDELDKRTEQAEQPAESTKFSGGEIVRNLEADRLQILFDEKPDEETRAALKQNGFRWSPRYSAWQRQLTRNAEIAARRALGLTE